MKPMRTPRLARLLKEVFCTPSALTLALLYLVVALSNAAAVQGSVMLNDWNGRFFNALQALDRPVVLELLLEFVPLAAALITLLVLAQYAKARLLIAMRRRLTRALVERWLSPRSAHFLVRESGCEPDNPDQRIIEDARSVVTLLVSLSLSLLESLFTIGSFSVILWNLSGSATVFGLEIPGYMLWICLAYTAVSAFATHRIGRTLRALNYDVQRGEADLRTAFIEKRRHAEAIAGAGGEARECINLKARLETLLETLIRLARKQRDLDFFTVGLGQATHLAPIFFALPALFAGRIQIGGLMQIRGAFVDTARAASWFIFAYDDLARLAACAGRLEELLERLEDAERLRTDLAAAIRPSREARVEVRMAIPRGDGAPQDVSASLSAAPGRLIALTGPSGVGKTTLFKIMAGFSRPRSGSIALPRRIFWAVQRPYLLRGTLRENLTYPRSPEEVEEKALLDALAAFGLEHLAPDLDAQDDWSARLSGGEQQRVGLIRAVFARPELLLIDEGTSALDPAGVLRALEALRRALPQAAVVFATHQSSVVEAADRVVRLSPTHS